jgi:5'(3')-deoxyribonucleotidase
MGNTAVKKQTILVDVHDVTLDLVGPWLRRYNRDYDDVLVHEDIKSWTMPDWVSNECGDKIYGYLSDPTLFEEMEPMYGAMNGIFRLRQMGHRVVFVTAANEFGYFHTVTALKKYHFLPEGIENKDVVNAADKNLIQGDILIDDRAEAVARFPGGKILFDRPWNRHQEMTGLGHRARGWEDIDVIVDMMTMRQEMGAAA